MNQAQSLIEAVRGGMDPAQLMENLENDTWYYHKSEVPIYHFDKNQELAIQGKQAEDLGLDNVKIPDISKEVSNVLIGELKELDYSDWRKHIEDNYKDAKFNGDW